MKAAQMVTPDGNGGPRWHCPQGTPSAKCPDLCAIPSQTLLYLGAPTCPKPSTPSPPSTASGVWGGQRMGSVLPELPPSLGHPRSCSLYVLGSATGGRCCPRQEKTCAMPPPDARSLHQCSHRAAAAATAGAGLNLARAMCVQAQAHACHGDVSTGRLVVTWLAVQLETQVLPSLPK